MLTFAYKVVGWVWQNAYVITRFTKKGQVPSLDISWECRTFDGMSALIYYVASRDLVFAA